MNGRIAGPCFCLILALILSACGGEKQPSHVNPDTISPTRKENTDSLFKAGGGVIDLETLGEEFFKSLAAGSFDSAVRILPHAHEIAIMQESMKKNSVTVPATNPEETQKLMLDTLSKQYIALRTQAEEKGINWKKCKLLTTNFQKGLENGLETADLLVMLNCDEREYGFSARCIRINLKWFLEKDIRFRADRLGQ